MFQLASKILLLVWILSVFLLAGCAQVEDTPPTPTLGPSVPTGEPTDATTPDAVSDGNDIGGYIELVDALRAAGATVEPGASVEQPFFDISGQAINVDGAEVQVFEFPDEATRESVSSLITPEGQPNPTTMVEWVDQPNFWAKGRIIVLYVGEDQTVIERLSQVLGGPITTSFLQAPLAGTQEMTTSWW